MEGSSMAGRPKRKVFIRDYSLLFKRPPKVQKTKANGRIRNGGSFAENANNPDICVKNEPVYDETDANLSMDITPDPPGDVVGPYGDEPLALGIDALPFPDAIVKDELIIEDVFEPLEENQQREVEGVEKIQAQDNSTQDETIAEHKIKKRKIVKKRLKRKKEIKRATTKVKTLKPSKTVKKVKKPKLAKIKPDVFVCGICDQKFSKNSAYIVHARYRHRPNFDPVVKKLKRNHSCEICGKKFLGKKGLFVHKQFHAKRNASLTIHEPPEEVTHDEDGRIQCSECSTKLSTREDYVAHYKWHMYLKQLDIGCNVCGELFEFKDHLISHLRTHKRERDFNVIEDENGMYKCSECMTTYGNRYQCIAHMQTHGTDFRCATCGKFWESEEKLRKHEKRHERTLANSFEVETDENGLFKCSECPRVYIRRTLCIGHMRTVHGKQQTKCQTDQKTPNGAEAAENVALKCRDCSKTFSNPTAFNQHRKRHQQIKAGRFRCKECGQNMSSKQLLESHILIHNRQRKNTNGTDAGSFTCSECDKVLPTWLSFSRHVMWHQKCNKNALFTCKICEMTFLSQHSLVKHRLVSHPGDGFDESTIATQLPPEDTDKSAIVGVSCPECGKIFTNRTNLRAHITRHNNIRLGRFPCKHCGRKHGTLALLTRHEVSHEQSWTDKK